MKILMKLELKKAMKFNNEFGCGSDDRYNQ